MKPFYIILLLLVSILPVAFGQRSLKIDSLQHLLSQTYQDTSRVSLLVELAQSYLFFKSDSSVILGQQAIELAQRLNFTKGEIQALNQFGETLRVRGEYLHALEVLFKARQISRNNLYQEGEAKSLHLIGLIYVGMGEYRQGLNYLHQAKKNYESLAQQFGGFGLSNIGNAYEEINMLDSALFYQQQAQDFVRQLPPNTLHSLILRRLGIIQGRLGNDSQALRYYQDALENTYITGDLLNRGVSQYLIAQSYHTLNQPDSSLHYAQLAFVNGKKVSSKRNMLDAASLLVNLYQAKSNLDSAFHYQQIAMATKDSLFSREKFQRLQLLTLTEQQRVQQLREEQARSEASFQRIGLLSALGVFLLIALLLWRTNHQQKHANYTLNQKNEQIESQRNDLEKTVIKLKATQNQLIQSEKMASLGELTAGIAHEIQNPLNFVNNFSEVSSELVQELRQEEDKEPPDKVLVKDLLMDLEQNLEKISHHGKRADSIVKSMLEHSRSSSGEKQLTNINALADEYLRLSYHGLRAKDKNFNAHTITDFDAKLGNLEVVPQELGRVLLNLFNNAFYATSQKKTKLNGQYQAEIHVSTKVEGDKVEIRVKDNGIGIPDRVKGKIFQPFFTTKPTGEGTGLGLSLSYDIITKGHGGELRVDSKEGEYSEFIIQLPIKPDGK